MHVDWAPGMLGMMTLLTVAATRVAPAESRVPDEAVISSAQGVVRD